MNNLYPCPPFEYKVFVDGGFQSKGVNYDWIFQRGLALAMYKDLSFTNTCSSIIIDKWTGGNGIVIITKEPILYPNIDKSYYFKF
jgi:hypothetical protein